MISCGITDVSPLEDLTNLSSLNLSNNEITNLGDEPFFGADWGIMANAGIGIGDTINLEGNPLSMWTLCSEVVDLEAQGVTVLASETCDDDPESTGSQDGAAHASATSKPKTRLMVIIKTINGSVGGSVEGGIKSPPYTSLTWSPLTTCFIRVISCHSDTELIQLTAVPQQYCAFFGWRETTRPVSPLYDEFGELLDTGDQSLAAGEEDSCRWIRDPTIQIKCPIDRILVASFFSRRSVQ